MEITGSVLKQYDDAMSFIRRNSRLSSVISGTERRDSMDYPTEAVREIVLNAIIHRDYRSLGSTLISVYDDCMEIASPGSLLEDIPESDLLKGASFPRNRLLAGIFYRLGMVEAYGTGIPRVMGIYENSTKKPKLVISSAMFRVTLPKNDHFGNEEWLTRGDIEKELGVGKSTAVNIINEMISKGQLIREGSGRNTRYRRVYP